MVFCTAPKQDSAVWCSMAPHNKTARCAAAAAVAETSSVMILVRPHMARLACLVFPASTTITLSWILSHTAYGMQKTSKKRTSLSTPLMDGRQTID